MGFLDSIFGGGDDAPEAPDFGEFTDLLKEVFEYSSATSQERLDWAKSTYEDNKLIGDQIVEFAMGQMDKLAAWADADRKRYEDIYQPLEEQQALKAQDYLTPERIEYEAGKAEADVAHQFNLARDAAAANLEQYGVDPSQIRQGRLDAQTRVAEGAAQASAGNQARWATEKYGDQLMANAIATGKNLPQQAMSEASGASQSANQSINTPLAVTASGSQTTGNPTTWSGLGTQALASAGQMMNAGYQNQLAQWSADQQSSSGFGDLLGFAASFIPGLQEGGAIPDDMPMEGRHIPEEMSPSAGAIPDDIPAEIDGDPNKPARLNAGEFVMPKDVVKWLGEKGMQQFILKARKEMGDPNQAPAKPEVGPPGAEAGPPMIPPRGNMAIPELAGEV